MHFLTEISEIHRIFVKISNVPGVRIDHKLIHTFSHKQKKTEYWEEGGEIIKLK